MGSETVHKIPVVNFSNENLKHGTSCWMSTCKDVMHALQEYGCFEAVYDKVSSDLRNAVFGAAEELFALPAEIKAKNTYDGKPYHGYLGQVASLPLHEGLGVDNAPTLEGTKSFTDIMWPQGNDHFCESVHLFSKLVAELDEMVMRMIFESLGVEKLYESYVGSANYLLRIMKNRGPKMNESNVGFLPHTDKSFTSIIHQNHVNGLAVKTKDGEWISYDPSASSFLFMAGDALMAWSNDRIHSAIHRVTMSGSELRYSLGLFTFSTGMVQTPEELIDDEHPLQYKTFDHLEYIRYFQKTLIPVKAYCGVN